MFSAPVISLGKDTTVCNGTVLQLKASGAQTYIWNNSDVTSTINVSPYETTTYTVTEPMFMVVRVQLLLMSQ